MTQIYRRKNPRINSLNLADVHILDETGIANCGIGRTLNLSEAGILLETHFPVGRNQHLALLLALGDDLLEIKGKVVYSIKGGDGKYQHGVRFTEYDEAAIPTLQSFVKKLKSRKNEEIIS